MSRPFVAIVALLAATVVSAQPHLVFDHKIGTDWPLDSSLWMSFVAISSDGRTVLGNEAVSLSDAHLGFWTFPDGKFLRTLEGVPLAVSADFRYLALEKQILDLKAGKPILTMAHKQDTLDAAAFSANGELVAVIASPHIVKGTQLAILRTADGSVASSFGTRHICAMAFAPNGQTIATGHWNNITLWNAQTGSRLAVMISPARKANPDQYWRDGRYLSAVAVSPDGQLVAAGSDDGELQVWNLATRKLVYATSLSGSEVGAEVTAVAFSPDSKLIAVGSYHDGTLRLVDAATGKLLSAVQVSMFGVGAVAFSPDGKYLVTPSNSGILENRKFSRGGSIRVFRTEK
jgi:WD40 repeat protein